MITLILDKMNFPLWGKIAVFLLLFILLAVVLLNVVYPYVQLEFFGDQQGVSTLDTTMQSG